MVTSFEDVWLHLMVREMMDSKIRSSEPYARLLTAPLKHFKGTRGLGISIKLQFSLGAIREYKLKHGERVDIIWERYNEVWDCPVLIIKRCGTQRILYGNRGPGLSPTSMRITMGTLVLQFHIPLLQHKLPILDYIDGEIWIDFGPEKSKQVKKIKKEIAAERFNLYFGSVDSQTVRWGDAYKKAIAAIAKSEDVSFNALILRIIDRYIQDDYPMIWTELKKIGYE